jgi:hypothetical protein
MALLTIARKMAAVALAVWKGGEKFGEKKLTRQAAYRAGARKQIGQKANRSRSPKADRRGRVSNAFVAR